MINKKSAENTALLSAYSSKEVFTYVIPLSRIDIDETGNKNKFIYYAKVPLNKAVFDTVIIDLTDDPTSSYAGDWTSLGYFRLRFKLRKVKVISTNPLTLEFEHHNQELLVPER